MTTLSNRIVTTRKEHRCFGCGRRRPAGSRMQHTVQVDGRDFLPSYWCPTCQAYWSRFLRHDDEITMGDLKSEDPEGWETVRREVEGDEPRGTTK